MELRDQLQKSLAHTYTLETELTGGGMARVFLATDTALGRRIVIKTLSPEVASGLNSERFQREIRVAAQLQHPCIVPVHAAGEVDGVPFYTMPFVEGQSLREQIKSGSLSVPTAIKVLRDLASALACAHASGVVHRDIKPENVLLSGGYAMVTDFGIAKALDAARKPTDKSGTLTDLNAMLGTPQYIAPEQAVGDPVDHRADIYSWGVLAYELLADGHPFRGKKTAQALIAAHVSEAPPPLEQRLSAAAATDPRASLLVPLVMRCLAKDPADRPADVTELVETLDALVDVTGEYRAVTPASGRASVRATPAEAPSVAVLPFTNLSADPENEYFSDGITEEIINAIAQLPGLQVAARTSAFTFKGKTVDLRTVGQQLGVQTVLEGSVRRAGNRLRITVQLVSAADGYRMWGERFDRELEDVFEIQDEIARAIADALRITLAPGADLLRRPTESIEAYHLYLRGQHFSHRFTREAAAKARDYFEQAIRVDPNYARAHAGLANVYLLMGGGGLQLMPAAEAIPLARAGAQRALALDPTIGAAHSVLGLVHLWCERDWAAAEQELRRAVQVEPNAALDHSHYSHYFAVVGRHGDAMAEIQRAMELDPLEALYCANAAWHLYTGRRFDDALSYCRRALDLQPGFGLAHMTRARVLVLKEQWDEAIVELTRMRERLATHVEPLLGYVHGRRNEKKEARAIAHAIEERRSRGAASAGALALVRFGMGERDAALEALEAAAREPPLVDVRGVLVFLKADPIWDPLRDEPRFEAVLRAIGLA